MREPEAEDPRTRTGPGVKESPDARVLRAELERRLCALYATSAAAFGPMGRRDGILVLVLFLLAPAVAVWIWR